MKAWLKMRDVEKRQGKVDLVVGLRRALETRVDFSGLPLISNFDDIKLHDYELAKLIV